MIHLLDANAVFRTAAESGGPFWLRQAVSDVNQRTLAGDMTIAVWDSFGANDYRRQWLSTYKTNRTPMDTTIFDGLKICRSLLERTTAFSISIPAHEADDIIAHLVNRYKATQKILIHTTDRDLLALCAHDNVTATVAPLEGLENDAVHTYKCLVGDPSDRIPGCPGFGQKAWESVPRVIAHQLVQHCDNPAMFERVVQQVPTKLQAKLLAGRLSISVSRKVVNFRPISDSVVNAALTAGSNEPDHIAAYFNRFML